MAHSSDPPARLYLGAAYYPEHWPEERWPEEIRLMQAAGLSVVRLAEFAWSSMEPAPGDYRLDWLERAIGLLAAAGIAVVLGTPTAAPPAWLTHTHPDSLSVDEHGRRARHGNRCHYCPTSPDMLAASARITRALAERFGRDPRLIGWQTDNELGRVCYCARCAALFRRFLEERYGDLDSLNRRWSTAYWSQSYTDWEQIPLPVGWHNPGLMLEWKRFVTRSNRDFQKLQVDILKEYLPASTWVTHNFMGWFGGFDHYALAADLDLASWDYYVGTGHHDHLGHGVTHDLTRGFKRKNYWVMETQPGNVNWSTVNNVLHKWEARAMAWQAVAHGADGVLYWQWRSALGGQEQYHGTLVDQSGQPRPFYQEVQALGGEFARLSGLVAGSTVGARVALLNDYESRWSIEAQRHHQDFDYIACFNHFARPLAAHGVNLDVISADEALTGYRLVIAPALLILDEERVARLKNFVAHGGHLVLTTRCGMKDRYNALLPSRQPGALAELTGVEVEDYYALDESVPVKGSLVSGSAQIWAERLKVIDPKAVVVAARYQAANGWLDGQPAITVRSQRGALVYYLGAYLDDRAQAAWMENVLKRANLLKWKLPPGIELRTRTRPDGQEIHFIINHGRAAQKLHLPWKSHDHLSEQDVEAEFDLAPYSIVVLTRREDRPAAPVPAAAPQA